MMKPMIDTPRKPAHAQRGATLAVVLILLLVMTLLGVFVLRGTLMEERMAAGTVDRSMAFLTAESALREAEAAIHAARQAGTPIGYDCDQAGVICAPVPSNAQVATSACMAGTFECWITASSDAEVGDLSAGRPQYYIEYMGQRTSADEFGLGDSANENQYGGGGGVPMSAFYRVTARSNNPDSDRSVVVLQSTVVAR